MEKEFRDFLLNSIRQTLYLEGKQIFEHEIEQATNNIESVRSTMKEYLTEVSNISVELAEEAVKELEKNDIQSQDDILANQQKVKQILGKFEGTLEGMLAGKKQ